eukprot:TRINITY_DN17588_c0_g1_i1.p1 TRINITY_DN17588_c0_g1~~TRINITY_DN17588_c0_g1_i1.p1  ORF type:complete len:776 (-),score=107.93 TRINITY_DN17588_c0_g1_i1:96-2423(-)
MDSQNRKTAADNVMIKQAYYNAGAIAFIIVLGGIVFQNLVIFNSVLHALFYAAFTSIFLQSLQKLFVKKTLQAFDSLSTFSEVPMIFSVSALPLILLFEVTDYAATLTSRFLMTWIQFFQDVGCFSFFFYVKVTLALVLSGIGLSLSYYIGPYTLPHMGNVYSWYLALIEVNYLTLTFTVCWIPCLFSHRLWESQLYSYTATLFLTFFGFPLPLIVSIGGIYGSAVAILFLLLVWYLGSTPRTRLLSRVSLKPKEGEEAKEELEQAPPTPSMLTANIIHNSGIDNNASDVYFYILYAIVALYLLYRLYPLLMDTTAMILIILIFVLYILLTAIKIGTSLGHDIITYLPNVGSFVSSSVGYALAPPVLFVLKRLHRGFLRVDRKIMHSLRKRVQAIVTILLVLIVIGVTLFLLMFFAIQIRNEASIAINNMYNQARNLTTAAQGNESVISTQLTSHSFGFLQSKEVQDALELGVSTVRSWVNNKTKTIFGPSFNTSDLEQKIYDLWTRTQVESPTKLFDRLKYALDYSNWDEQIWKMIKSSQEVVWNSIPALKEGLMRFPGWILSTLARFSQILTDFLFSLVVYVSMLYVFMRQDTDDPLEVLLTIFPVTMRDPIYKVAANTVREVCQSAMKTAFYHGLATWVSLESCGASFVYLPALISALLAVVPIIPSFLVGLPFVAELIIRDQFGKAMIVTFVQLAMYFVVDPAIYAEISASNSYITTLSVVGGMAAFGLDGIFLGPMLVCALMIAWQAFSLLLEGQFLEDNQEPNKLESLQ